MPQMKCPSNASGFPFCLSFLSVILLVCPLYTSVCKHYSLMAPTIHYSLFLVTAVSFSMGLTHKTKFWPNTQNLTGENNWMLHSVPFISCLPLSSCTARRLGGHICQSNKQQTVGLAQCDAPALLGHLHVWPRHQTCPSGLPVRPVLFYK